MSGKPSPAAAPDETGITAGNVATMRRQQVALDGTHRVTPLLQTKFDERNGIVSPDGRWLAYESNSSGPVEIYVRPFPNVGGGQWLVSTAGGRQPLWARSGKELYYLSADGALMAVPIHSTPAFSPGTPTKLFDTRYFAVGNARTYDVSRDGQTFLMIKAAGGGGGIGMSAAADESQLRAGFETARSRAERFFANPAILLERYMAGARHVEVQILGLADGRVVALGERDCSVQRRHQKVAEETPSPGVTPQLRARMLAAAVRAGEAVGYRGAGTVECLVDTRAQDFVFLEMNTRLQVEHPVTEMVTGIDLVEQQFLIADGADVSYDLRSVSNSGHAVELRVYAEDPRRFLPSPGMITQWEEPAGQGVRVDAGYAAGNTVTPFYDPLLAKLCLHGASRAEALERARAAVAAFRIAGPKTNLPFHAELLDSSEFSGGSYDTSVVARLRP